MSDAERNHTDKAKSGGTMMNSVMSASCAL
jgi:hypothetical protein